VQEVSAENARLTVAIPEGDAVAPEGPLQRGECQAPEPLAAACASADLLLTLVPLDPAVGSEYLAGWADSVVAMVTAGRSTATRIRSVGEMIRLAGTPLVSAVLVGADKRDESLGLTPRTGRGGQDESVTSAVVPRWSVDRR
jgi:hypothetical protein